MTNDEKRHLGRVAELGCCICKRPAEVHHIRTGVGAGRRATHYQTIPLCPMHHRTGGYRLAIHAGQAAWERRYGTELFYLDVVQRALGIAE